MIVGELAGAEGFEPTVAAFKAQWLWPLADAPPRKMIDEG